MESSWHQGNSSNATKKMDISLVKAFLDEHYSEMLSLESVAGQFFIDKHYLARLFKEQYGATLVTYLQHVRITHAKRMLWFTDKNIEEIGLECDVGDLSYFSRVSKNWKVSFQVSSGGCGKLKPVLSDKLRFHKNKYRILISTVFRYILNTQSNRSVYIYAASQGFQE